MTVDVTKDMTADEYVQAITTMVNDRAISKLPFFERLERGEITREQLLKCVYQMMWYYNNSVRNLGCVLSKKMDLPARTAVMENLIDEETE